MRILVIGGGGREHTLVWKIAMSPKVGKIYCIPGNPGIGQIAECVDISIADNAALVDFARTNHVDLTVVGPELPLTNGLVDAFAAAGLKAFGPTRAAAELEGSKAFAKELMQKYAIPTAGFAVFTDAASAKAFIRKTGAPVVVKADGLAAGKGVVVAMTIDEAFAAVDMMMRDQAFGLAGSRVVIEEYLTGEEASLLAFTDGYTVVPMISAQDHKRAYDGDQGPNTGGMGTYAPAPVVTPAVLEQVRQQVLQPAVDAMRQEGRLYRGCLYAGLMISEKGPKVIEFNARFGDPETQVVLPLLASDLVTVMEACIDGTLADLEVVWEDQAAVCVVMAAGGYPGSYATGDVISGIERAEQAGAMVFQAGTAAKEETIVTNGGRVLGVTAKAPTIKAAVEKAYAALQEINFIDMHYRRDIAHRAMEKRS
ncbi:phosphoribosylamine--glycine ligase|uniref:Phosphoribosylamine--glycine ligase n=1 Tax=Dendrosporobacter quercicolus TaxID=146817 RepID=A0A1G9NY07_9FIRM|nr:phosphoribosylamine--glycine ligase [Dendrosporobacter quercicolus]NSL47480.1 phosphoribosylamine--glycine ligase [Dendrosporobacter quercicolus DSM 1736]SDL91270.1 phosphoribosylamine--glycine ligase [Dendrosporobacter quercicolus]